MSAKPSHKGIPHTAYIEAGWTEQQLLADGYDSRPVIRIEGGALFTNVTAMSKLLAEQSIVFMFIGSLGITSTLRPSGTTTRYCVDLMSGMRVQWIRVTPAWLRRELMQHFRFEKYDGRSKDWQAADCPKEYVSLLIRDAQLFFPSADPETLWESMGCPS